MLIESVRAIIRARRQQFSSVCAALARILGSTLFHLRMRFRGTLKIYVSVIPVWGIGYVIGLVGAVMGIGGGFLLGANVDLFPPHADRDSNRYRRGAYIPRPWLSLHVMHALTNHLVDAVLALGFDGRRCDWRAIRRA